MSVELPPLPEPFDTERYFVGNEDRLFDLYTDDQMRAYAEEALKARKPLTGKHISAVVRSVQPNLSTTCKAWGELYEECRYWLAAERAHGIGEQA